MAYKYRITTRKQGSHIVPQTLCESAAGVAYHIAEHAQELPGGITVVENLEQSSDLLALLKQLNEILSGCQEYEGLWLNPPHTPAVTPAKLVRHALGLPTE